MKIIDCIWEVENLGDRTAEVIVEKGDAFQKESFEEIERKYSYVVVKVPMKQVEYNWGLSHLGYIFSEIQCKLYKKFCDFNFNDKFIKMVYDAIDFKEIHDEQLFNEVIENITPNMFSTDRITLDPYYGPEIGCQRYKNWMRTAFDKKTAKFIASYYKNQLSGFSMYRKDKDIVDGILGGNFQDFQSSALGIITPTRHFLYAQKNNVPFKKYHTSISSNNVPVWQLYNYLNYKIDQLYYVFVKHIKNDTI